VHRGMRIGVAALVVALLGAACASESGSSDRAQPEKRNVTDTSLVAADKGPAPGAQRLHYEFGPIDILPGQNNITYSKGQVPKPPVAGWITRIKPDLRRADGSVPRVDVIHLHHGVWLNASGQDSTAHLPERFFAAGEEKTIMQLPEGYGYEYQPTDNWTINYMIHNLTTEPDKVWITYDLDFIAADSPAAANIQAARPIWMDVQNGSVYPVFDAVKGTGQDGRYEYPDDATDPYGGRPAKNRWTVDRDGVLIATAGHLHPGGLYDDLYIERAGAKALQGHDKPGRPDTAHLFRSMANYYEPAGAVSWDVAMTATKPNWRVAVKAGDVLETSATYDTKRASWYESMGIMVLWMADGTNGADPFTTAVDQPGLLTHGHLPENDHHGGKPAPSQFVNALKLPSQPDPATTIPIENFVYARGDLTVADSVPTVAQGASITFDNSIDAPIGVGIWHTITACKAPCNRTTGVAYPLADGDVNFDSGELGVAGPPTADRLTWSTPADLPTGTYTYFCRIHPSMRGAFRVTSS
jgi:plastocyanin